MADYILKNGKKVELTESMIDEIVEDTERRIDNSEYHVAYASENDSERTRPLLAPQKKMQTGKAV